MEKEKKSLEMKIDSIKMNNSSLLEYEDSKFNEEEE